MVLKCMSSSQMERFLETIDAEYVRLAGSILIQATEGNVLWKWHSSVELYCVKEAEESMSFLSRSIHLAMGVL